MKLKYYLRGMGIGIIVTTIILMISFSQREVEISDEQVMVRAAALGMVMAEEEEEPTTEMSTGVNESVIPEDMVTESIQNDIQEEMTEVNESESEIETETEIVTEEPVSEEDDMTQVDLPTEGTYRLVINKGDVCRVVCEDLQKNGVVADAEALRKHLFEIGYANSISTGVYDVPYGLTMEEVAQIIVAGPIEE